MTEQIHLSGEMLLAYRTTALQAASTVHAGQTVPEVMHAAGCYLAFLLTGEPIHVIGQTVRETAGLPPGAATDVGAAVASPKRRTKAEMAAATLAAAPAAAQATAAPAIAPAMAQTAIPAQTAAVAAVAQPATSIAPPTDIKSAVEAFKALVNGPIEGGRGRDVALALLAEFKVAQLSQVPPAQLAEFKRRCDTAGLTAAVAADPMQGLL